jgi:hypothetical protein
VCDYTKYLIVRKVVKKSFYCSKSDHFLGTNAIVLNFNNYNRRIKRCFWTDASFNISHNLLKRKLHVSHTRSVPNLKAFISLLTKCRGLTKRDFFCLTRSRCFSRFKAIWFSNKKVAQERFPRTWCSKWDKSERS